MTYSIVPPRESFIDPRTNTISQAWYRFLLELWKTSGSGQATETLAQVSTTTTVLSADISSLEDDVATLQDDFDTLSKMSGPPGYSGQDGEDGIQGFPGPMGLMGERGPMGLNGSDGEENYQFIMLQPAGLSGKYTPTLTNVANLSASTAYECQYFQIANVVSVSGKVDIDPTLTTTLTQLGISLPIASNFGASEDCSGTAFCNAVAAQGAAIVADTTNNRAQLEYVSADISNQSMYFTFQYEVI